MQGLLIMAAAVATAAGPAAAATPINDATPCRAIQAAAVRNDRDMLAGYTAYAEATLNRLQTAKHSKPLNPKAKTDLMADAIVEADYCGSTTSILQALVEAFETLSEWQTFQNSGGMLTPRVQRWMQRLR